MTALASFRWREPDGVLQLVGAISADKRVTASERLTLYIYIYIYIYMCVCVCAAHANVLSPRGDCHSATRFFIFSAFASDSALADVYTDTLTPTPSSISLSFSITLFMQLFIIGQKPNQYTFSFKLPAYIFSNIDSIKYIAFI